MALEVSKTIQSIFLIGIVLTITLLILVWSLSVYKNDFTEIDLVKMESQESCLLKDLNSNLGINKNCIKPGFSAVITIDQKTTSIGEDITSKLAFCNIKNKNFICLKRHHLINNKEVQIGIAKT